jgi:hypothetical protein
MKWLDLIPAAVTGGIGLKTLEWGFGEYRRRSESARSTGEVVLRQLDPFLKATDDLAAKLRSLAERDFQELQMQGGKPSFADTVAIGSLLYLFSVFWARIEILKRESLYVKLAEDKTGAKLKAFIDCLEARKVRLVSRAWQMGIGECLIERQSSSLECIGFRQFIESLSSAPFGRWLIPLQELLLDSADHRKRQRILLYGCVLHALIDTLDPKHQVTGNRPGYANKLDERSRRELRHRIFGVYLRFVKNQAKYAGE